MEAVEKIRSEMQQNQNNPYIQFIGDFLTKELQKNPAAAVGIMEEGKTIAKSLDAMAEVAKKKPRIGNCAMLTPEEGINIVLKYFGINNEHRLPAPDPAPAPEPVKQATNPAIDFDISLEDLL